MRTVRVTLIAAMAENRVIGREGRIPWHLSDDLRRFKRLTTGHTIIMGRKTWDSLGRALPGRENVVVTRQRGLQAPGATVVGSLDEALRHAQARGDAEAFVIGGGEIYREALPRADRLELTLVHAAFEGDARFPEIDPAEWIEAAREEHAAPAKDGEPPLRYAFVTLDRAGT